MKRVRIIYNYISTFCHGTSLKKKTSGHVGSNYYKYSNYY